MSAPVSVTWVGGRELIARLAKAQAVAVPALAGALYREANDILAAAIPITPIEFGTLRASGHVTLPVVTASGAEVTIGFGGAAAPYAVYVHENLQARHATPTQAKFLEHPVMAASKDMASRLGLDLKLVL